MSTGPKWQTATHNWFPDNAPRGVLGGYGAGDLLIVMGTATGNAPGVSVNGPAGWGAWQGYAVDWSTVFVWWRVATGGEGGQVYGTAGGGQGANWYTRTYVIPAGKFDPSDPLRILGHTTNNGTQPTKATYFPSSVLPAATHPYADSSFVASMLGAEARNVAVNVVAASSSGWNSDLTNFTFSGPGGSFGYVHRSGWYSGALGAGSGILPNTTGNAASNVTWRKVSIITVPLTPPTITGVGTSQVPGSQVVTFTPTVSGHGITAWSWDFGDGGPGSTVKSPTRAYVPGTYTVTVTCANVAGTSNTYQLQVVVSPPAPTAKMTWVRTPGLYVITASDLSSWNDTASNVWKLDGVTEQTGGAEFIHDLGGPGQYELTLEVSNTIGTDSVTQVAQVTDEYTAIDRADGITVAIVAGTNDVTCEAMTATWTFGALDDEGPLTTPVAGRLELQLLDRYRRLDPNNRLATIPLTLGLDLFMYAGPTGSTDPLTLMWRGWIERAVHDGSTLRISGYDSIGRMTAAKAAQDGPTSRPAEGLSTRLVALLDTMAWPSALRDITDDTTQLAATTYAGADIWGLMVQASEGRGHVSVDAAGTVRYVPRHLFEPDTPEVALHCDDLVEVLDTTELPKVINDAVVGNADSGTRRAQDATSQATYGMQATNINVPFTAGSVLDAAASDVITAMAKPRLKQEAELRVPAAKLTTYAALSFGRQVNVQHVAYHRPGSILLGGRWSMGLEQTELTALAVLPDYLAPSQRSTPTPGTYGLGGRAGVVQHDHEGGILRPAAIEGLQSGAVVYQTQPQTLTNANFTNIVFDAVYRDDDGYYDPAYPTRLTAQRTGWHFLTAAYDAYNQDRVFSNFRLNGSTSWPQGRIQMAATRVGAMNATPVWLEAGWYIEWALWTTDAGGDHKTYPSNEAGPVMSMVYM